MTGLWTPIPIYDHERRCIGCRAPWAAPCESTCPFRTREFGPAVVLRAAWCWLGEYEMRVGYDLGGALAFAAADLVETGAAAHRLASDALIALTGYLAERDTTASGGETIRKLARGEGVEIGRALYGAAARVEGVPFDPDLFDPSPCTSGVEGGTRDDRR